MQNMNYGRDIMCPQCRSMHGAAATNCECGYVFEVPVEDPAPAHHFFLLALFFGAVTILASMYAQNKGYIYLPIGGLLCTGASGALGVRSWIYFFLKSGRIPKKTNLAHEYPRLYNSNNRA